MRAHHNGDLSRGIFAQSVGGGRSGGNSAGLARFKWNGSLGGSSGLVTVEIL